ncbi:MAG TPA: DUF3187 family protein [Longimicrobiales bacterium]|nr:DUF3187 family protein [Longimicrobiales bacterium]
MPRLTAALTATLVLLADTGALGAQPLGPLTSEEGAPLQRLGFTPTMEGVILTPRGTVRTDVWVGYASIWEQDSSAVANVFLDLERVVTAATVRVGVADRLELGARATLERTGGGFLDGGILAFHKLIRMGDRRRRDYPRDAYGQWLRDADGTLLVEIPGRSVPTLEDVRVFAKAGLVASADGRRALAVKAELRIPTAENTVGPERADAALTLMGRAALGSWHVHALAGGTTARRSPELAGVLRSRQWVGMLGVERPLNTTLSVVAQLTGSTQLLRDFGDHDVDGAPTNLVFGLVGRASGGWRWEAAMQEDVPARGPSNDFAVQLSLGRTW